jgi:hypothetical protein
MPQFDTNTQYNINDDHTSISAIRKDWNNPTLGRLTYPISHSLFIKPSQCWKYRHLETTSLTAHPMVIQAAVDSLATESNVWIVKPGRPSFLQQTPEGFNPIKFEGIDTLQHGNVVLITAELEVTKNPGGYEMMMIPQEIITIGHLSMVRLSFCTQRFNT